MSMFGLNTAEKSKFNLRKTKEGIDNNIFIYGYLKPFKMVKGFNCLTSSNGLSLLGNIKRTGSFKRMIYRENYTYFIFI